MLTAEDYLLSNYMREAVSVWEIAKHTQMQLKQ